MPASAQLSQPGTATLLWTTTDPSIATVTAGGFLQAHLPGTVAVTVIAGGESAQTSVMVLARPIGLAFAVQPGTVELGDALDPAPSVEVVDARGARVESYSGPIEVELQDRAVAVIADAAAQAAPGSIGVPQAAPLNGTTTVDAVNGVVSFDDLVIPEGGLFRLLATAPGLDPAASNDFEVTLMVADIFLDKLVDMPVVLEGDQVTFTITVVNNGPATATGVSVSDPLSEGFLLVSATPSQGVYTAASGMWDVGTLANGEIATLTLLTTIASGTGGQTLENVAAAVPLTDQLDDPENNEAAVLVDVGQRVADLMVTKAADEVEVREGEEVVFTITVVNLGPDRADQVTVVDHLPHGLELVSADPEAGTFNLNTGEWDLGSLEAGVLARLFLRAVVVEGQAGETLTNTATATELAHQEDAPGNNSASASILAVPQPTDPEDHTFLTLGNLQLEGGTFALPAPPFSSPPAVDRPTVKTHSLTKNTPTVTVVSTGSQSTAQGGTVIVNSDGSFLYTPPLGFKDGQDSFTYTTAAGLTATVTIDVSDLVWFVNNTADGGMETGQSDLPFDALVDAQTASGPRDIIFVFSGDGTSNNQDAGIVLKTGQILVGEGVPIDLTEEGIGIIHPAGTPPVITNTAGHAVELADGSEVAGIHIDNASGRSISADNVDGGDIFEVLITNSGDNAIKLLNTTGTFQFGNVTITDATRAGLKISDGDPDVSFFGSITGSGNFAIDIARTTGGFVGLGGTFESGSGSSGGVNLSLVDGDVAIAGLDVMGGSALGVDIAGGSGTFVFTDLQIDGATSGGFRVQGGTSTVVANLGSGGINQGAGDAVDIQNLAGGGSVTFNGNTINDTQGRGIFLDSNVGAVTFNSDVDVLDPASGGAPPPAPPEVVTVDEVASVLAPNGVVVIQNGTGPLTFQSLDIMSLDGTSALVMSNHSGLVTVMNGSITSDGNEAVFAEGSNANFNFGSVDVNNSSNGGMYLYNNTGTFTFSNVDIAITNGIGMEIDDTGTVNVNGSSNTIATIGVSGSKQALYIYDTNIDMAFQSVTVICDTCSTGIYMEDAVGPLLIDGGAINGTTSTAIDIWYGSGDFRFDGTIVNGSGNSVSMIAKGTGTTQFGGLITDTGSGISLQSNSGTIRFDGGLALNTGSSKAFYSTNGGTLEVTGTNTVTTTTGTAVHINNTTIGGGGVTFQSVSSNGLNPGIILNGATGGTFMVSGSGSVDGSGGLIQNASGVGVSLTSSENV